MPAPIRSLLIVLSCFSAITCLFELVQSDRQSIPAILAAFGFILSVYVAGIAYRATILGR